ncbi:hypothetical protein [Methylotenera versatilis]|uniref:hypothetical protein n=1 Tax=Methylotenera versatilis TaxID=1055487 RepID=UPI0006483689|nr:hypothetical protein [Methylotenera versatilis]
MKDISAEDLAEIRNIQMLLGRNVLIFQNVEHILKLIHQFKEGKGTFENLHNRKKKIDELSLGRLTDETYLKKIDSKFNKEESDQYYFSYNSLPDNEALNTTIKFFNDINDDRNFIIHNFCKRWHLDHKDHRVEAKNWLVKQYDDVLANRAVLIDVMQMIVSRTLMMNEFVNSSEGVKALEELEIASNYEGITFAISP